MALFLSLDCVLLWTAVLDAGVLSQVVRLLEHGSDKVVDPALRIVGNMVTGDDEQTQQVLDARPAVPGKPLPSALEAAERRLSFARALLEDSSGNSALQVRMICF